MGARISLPARAASLVAPAGTRHQGRRPRDQMAAAEGQECDRLVGCRAVLAWRGRADGVGDGVRRVRVSDTDYGRHLRRRLNHTGHYAAGVTLKTMILGFVLVEKRS